MFEEGGRYGLGMVRHLSGAQSNRAEGDNAGQERQGEAVAENFNGEQGEWHGVIRGWDDLLYSRAVNVARRFFTVREGHEHGA